jgi:hypothetical protein
MCALFLSTIHAQTLDTGAMARKVRYFAVMSQRRDRILVGLTTGGYGERSPVRIRPLRTGDAG